MPKVTYQIDGADFSTLDEFYDKFYAELIPGRSWGKSLDDLQDLVGGYCTEEYAFRVIWRNSALSRERLGYSETVHHLKRRLLRCHSGWRPMLNEELDKARRREGPTVFDWLVEILSYPPLELALE